MDNNGDDDDLPIEDKDLIEINLPHISPDIDFKEMADDLRELMESIKAQAENGVDPDDEQQVDNLIDLFTKAKIKSDVKILEMEKRREVLKLLYEVERHNPTDILVIGLIPVPGQPDNLKQLMTLTTLKTVQEANHLLDSAKTRML